VTMKSNGGAGRPQRSPTGRNFRRGRVFLGFGGKKENRETGKRFRGHRRMANQGAVQGPKKSLTRKGRKHLGLLGRAGTSLSRDPVVRMSGGTVRARPADRRFGQSSRGS